MVHFTSNPYIMILASILLGSAGQLMLKNGMNPSARGVATEAGTSLLLSALKGFTNPWVIFGFLCYGISSIIWLMILKKVPLSTAYPMISLAYVVVVVLSAAIFKEPVRWSVTGLGLAFIIAGVSLIGFGMVKPGGH